MVSMPKAKRPKADVAALVEIEDDSLEAAQAALARIDGEIAQLRRELDDARRATDAERMIDLRDRLYDARRPQVRRDAHLRVLAVRARQPDVRLVDLRADLEAVQRAQDAAAFLGQGMQAGGGGQADSRMLRAQRDGMLRDACARRKEEDQKIKLLDLQIGDLPQRVAEADEECDYLYLPLTAGAEGVKMRRMMGIKDMRPSGTGSIGSTGMRGGGTEEHRRYVEAVRARNALAAELKPLQNDRDNHVAARAAHDREIDRWFKDNVG